MMKRIPAALVKTWLFLVKSNDPKLAKQKLYAYQKIKTLFGTTQVAEVYIEQENDHDIEIVIV
ncbi:MAG: hypothetical protein HRT53_07955 [Colwellia sp.]|nr:hypothetical protein [Colwellia sp.]